MCSILQRIIYDLFHYMAVFKITNLLLINNVSQFASVANSCQHSPPKLYFNITAPFNFFILLKTSTKISPQPRRKKRYDMFVVINLLSQIPIGLIQQLATTYDSKVGALHFLRYCFYPSSLHFKGRGVGKKQGTGVKKKKKKWGWA